VSAITWIDSHCHIQDQYMPGGVGSSEVIDEATAAGVVGVVCVGTDLDASRQAVDLVTTIRATRSGFGAWATAGLHPHEASEGLEVVEQIEGLIEETQSSDPGLVVAVGECGLDYHYDHSPRPEQRVAFEAQIELAKRRDLTLVIHTRSAWDDTFDILRSVGTPDRVVIHCFTGGPEEAKKCLEIGAFLSFSGITTFKGAPEVREAAEICPADHLLVETDAPFLAPVPYRGKQNRPAWVSVVGEAVAGFRGERPEDLAASTSAAFRSAFAIE
jgi:TatD DNase family protein